MQPETVVTGPYSGLIVWRKERHGLRLKFGNQKIDIWFLEQKGTSMRVLLSGDKTITVSRITMAEAYEE
jgi:hypothetical protein